MQEELTSRMGEKESVTKSGVQLLAAQKANEEARLVERKVCFIPEAGSKEGLGTGMLVFISRSWYELTSSFLLEIVFFFWGKNSGGKKNVFYQSSFL